MEKIIYELNNPPKIIDIAIDKNKIFYCELNSKITEIVKVMYDNNYTHIPVYNGDKCIGIFCEDTMLKILKDGFNIKSNDELKQIEKHIYFDNYRDSVKFLPKSLTVQELYNYYKDEFIKQKKLSCVFITENGDVCEEILGMVTAWDILGRDI